MADAVLDVRRLSGFLAAYREAHARPVDRWVDSPPPVPDALGHVRPALAPPAPERPLLNSARLAALFDALRGPLAEARAEGALLNPWTMAGLGRNEVRNAGVLAGFLAERLCGRLSIDFLDTLLAPLRPQAKDIPSRTELEAGYNVRTEHCVSGGQRDRVDLTMEGRSFVLGIEVKIDAMEGDRQLERYIETIRAWGERTGKTSAVIFLSPLRPSIQDVPWVNWRDVAAAATRVTLRQREQPYSHKLLCLFAKHTQQFWR